MRAPPVRWFLFRLSLLTAGMTVAGLMLMALPHESLSTVWGADPATSPSAKIRAGIDRRPLDDRGLPLPRQGLVETLRDQVQQSPVLGDLDETNGLLESLDEAASLFANAKRRNRDALRQLNRQVRMGEAGRAPHLVIFLVDQMPANGLDPVHRATFPQIIAAADRGLRFKTAYAGSTDLDTSFWTLMQGQNTGRLPAGRSTSNELTSESTLASCLWKAGYTTAFLGAWSAANHPLDVGFDHFCGVITRDQPAEQFPARLSLARTTMMVPANANGQQGVSFERLLEIEADSWLASRREENRPFCLMVRLPQWGSNKGEPTPADALTQANFDRTFGQFMTLLQDKNLLASTNLIFTALAPTEAAIDGLRERDLRVPCFVAGPAISQTGVQESPVAMWDWLPTTLDLARANRQPRGLDGRSMGDAFRQQAGLHRPLLYWRAPQQPANQAVRHDQWKGIYSAKDERIELYDVANDPAEQQNLAVQHPDIVRSLLRGDADKIKTTVDRSLAP